MMATKKREYTKTCIVCGKTYTCKRIDTLICSSDCKYELSKQKAKNRLRDSNENVISNKVRWEIFTRDNFKCHYCGATTKDGIRLEIDHIMPFSKGGDNSKDNLVTACNLCNAGKGDLLIL